MGFGGTNFHVAIEEYDNYSVRPGKIYRQGSELFLVSGNSKEEILTSFKYLSFDKDHVRADVIKNFL